MGILKKISKISFTEGKKGFLRLFKKKRKWEKLKIAKIKTAISHYEKENDILPLIFQILEEENSSKFILILGVTGYYLKYSDKFWGSRISLEEASKKEKLYIRAGLSALKINTAFNMRAEKWDLEYPAQLLDFLKAKGVNLKKEQESLLLKKIKK